jgi:phosphoribosyl 1,2-cyclic phosphodiesterase
VSASVRFLGTGGARFVVAHQIRASGGIWLRFSSEDGPVTQIHVDPGPGALVRALSALPPCVPGQLDALALSHKHLDHAGDVNVMIEAMTHGGWRPRGALLAPLDALEGDPVVFPYARRFVPVEHVLTERGGPWAVNDVRIRASVRHRHPVETYGLHFAHLGTTISYLPCTRFFEELAADYRAHSPDVLIINVLRFRDAMDVDHLTFEDARRLIAEIGPKVAVMTHFGTKMLERRPPLLAAELEAELGLRVYAARDGWTLDVDTEVAAVTGARS